MRVREPAATPIATIDPERSSATDRFVAVIARLRNQEPTQESPKPNRPAPILPKPIMGSQIKSEAHATAITILEVGQVDRSIFKKKTPPQPDAYSRPPADLRDRLLCSIGISIS